jgi:hypothetical protein
VSANSGVRAFSTGEERGLESMVGCDMLIWRCHHASAMLRFVEKSQLIQTF